MELGPVEILTAVGIAILVLHYYLTKNFDFWRRKNVVGPKPLPFFGNFKDNLFGKVHIALLFEKFCRQFKDAGLIGLFGLNGKPSLIVRDPDLLKDVLIKDFHVFQDRGLYVDAKVDPLNQNLLNLEHERWRPLRNKLSPVFTSGKLKEMFYLIVDCARHFEDYVNTLVDRDEAVEFRELTAKFTTQTIGVCAFGLDTKAIHDEDSDFRKFGKAIFSTSLLSICKRLLQDSFPKIYALFGVFGYSKANRFFIRTIKETVEYRKKNNVRRNDFVDLLMDMQGQPEKMNTIDFTDMFLTGQALVFFAAGFETSSTTMSNALYELALHPEFQDKVRKEIRGQIEKNEGQLTYDCIKQMKYLDQVVKETLRKYPPGSILRRKSSEEYTFNGTDVTIPKGTSIFIPVWAIHRDPQIYEDPDTFDPERFSEENVKDRHPMNYLPFGDGPHNCIGLRFANYQTKVGIITVINKFKVNTCRETIQTYRVEPRPIIPTPEGGIRLKLSKC
ncbi:hypothetical protein QAD02_008847 [Eretmocerus hayati]|uniref:Uncharacterized protein n=1 Tax=Eretmocerus hayati TaxID=131215 RepID=A0ACC2NC12_9HYME|nr:hypothetical protein QAD02_008847 [Eretmocerus hayati]